MNGCYCIWACINIPSRRHSLCFMSIFSNILIMVVLFQGYKLNLKRHSQAAIKPSPNHHRHLKSIVSTNITTWKPLESLLESSAPPMNQSAKALNSVATEISTSCSSSTYTNHPQNHLHTGHLIAHRLGHSYAARADHNYLG